MRRGRTVNARGDSLIAAAGDAACRSGGREVAGDLGVAERRAWLVERGIRGLAGDHRPDDHPGLPRAAGGGDRAMNRNREVTL
jgi:hypothetical protein